MWSWRTSPSLLVSSLWRRAMPEASLSRSTSTPMAPRASLYKWPSMLVLSWRLYVANYGKLHSILCSNCQHDFFFSSPLKNPEPLVTTYSLPLTFGLLILPEGTSFAHEVTLQASLQDVGETISTVLELNIELWTPDGWLLFSLQCCLHLLAPVIRSTFTSGWNMAVKAVILRPRLELDS